MDERPNCNECVHRDCADGLINMGPAPCMDRKLKDGVVSSEGAVAKAIIGEIKKVADSLSLEDTWIETYKKMVLLMGLVERAEDKMAWENYFWAQEEGLIESQQKEVRHVDDYFGVCPECGKSDGYRNIHKSHIFFCDTHKVRWCIGYNLFSSWQYEDEEVWKENAGKLGPYREIEPLHFCLPDCQGNCVAKWEEHFKTKYPSDKGHFRIPAAHSEENFDDIPF